MSAQPGNAVPTLAASQAAPPALQNIDLGPRAQNYHVHHNHKDIYGDDEEQDPDAIQPSTPSSNGGLNGQDGSSDAHYQDHNGDNKTLADVEEDGADGADRASSVEGLVSDKSKGVAEMEMLMERINVKYLCFLYGGFAILAYVLSLNQYTAGTLLTAATSTFGQHSLQATINVVTAVFQAMSQPPIAKFADYFGRIQAYITCVVLYAIGYCIVPAANNIVTYAVGNSIYILGITGLFFLQNVIISDISTLRNRYWWTSFPNIPGGINIWVGAEVLKNYIGANQEYAYRWRWGFGMFTILVPVLSLPIIITLYLGIRPKRQRRQEIRAARRADPSRITWSKFRAAPGPVASQVLKDFKRSFVRFFWQLDFIGLFLFVAGFGMFFCTITTANSRVARWSDTHSICLLVFGFLAILAFVIWETFFAPVPLLPFQLIKRRNVIGSCLIALVHPMSGAIVNGYFTTYLWIAVDMDTVMTGYLTGTSSFAAIVVAFFASIACSRWRRLKPIILLGFFMQTIAFGLMIRFRQSGNARAVFFVIQVMKGFGIGCISFPVQAIIQSAAPHEHLSSITAAYLVIFYMSSGIGSAIGGSIWTNMLPRALSDSLNNVALETLAFGDPLSFKAQYGMGTPERIALNTAQDDAQRIIVIVGTCVCFVGLLVAVFIITNVLLPDSQSMEESALVEDKATQRAAGRRERLNRKTKEEKKEEKEIVAKI